MKTLPQIARSAIRWFRAVWPPLWIVVAIIATCGLCELIFFAARRAFGEFADPQQFHLPRDGTLLIGAAFYGIYRVAGFHPVFDTAYFDWLRLTPWKAGKSLPLGPVHIAAQDGAFLAMLLALGEYHPSVSLACIPLVMLAAYCCSSLIALCYTGPTWCAYVLAFGLALVGRLAWISPWTALAAVVPVAIFSQVTLRLSLAAFPWELRLQAIRARFAQPRDSTTAPRRNKSQQLAPEAEFTDVLRLWPHGALHTDGRARLLTRLDFAMISLLAGFAAYCTSAGAPHDRPDEPPLLIALSAWVMFSAVILRLFVYFSHHSPPITIAGRIATGRWLIPGYDIVFLTPLVVFVAWGASLILLSMVDAPLSVTLEVTTSVCLLIAFLGGPSLRRWQLTCPSRLTAAVASTRSAERL